MSEQLIDYFNINEEGFVVGDWDYQDRKDIPEEILNESTDKLTKQEVIGRVVGEMFAVNGRSGNKRFYSRKLWETALGKTKATVLNGMMMGTVGHNQPIDEKAILEGKISHRVSRLWIDESTKKGMGEILIMNTDSGRNLNALLKSGVKFPVSSRAFGDFSGKTDEGLDIVNPETYELKGFDFVINPGIASAIPSIVESLNDPEKNMSDSTLLTTLTEEKIQLNRQLTEANSAVEVQKGRAELAESRLETASTALNQYQALGKVEDVKNIVESFNQVNTDKLQLESQVVAYKYLGTPEEIEEALQVAEQRFTEYSELGSPEEIREALDHLRKYVEIGTCDQISESLKVGINVNQLGTPEEIEEAMEAASHTIQIYKELGTPAQIEEALDVLESYVDLGTPEEVQEALTRALDLVDTVKRDRQDKKNEALAKELKVPVSVVESFDGKSEDEIRTLITTIHSAKDSNLGERYQAPENSGNRLDENLNDKQPKSSINESRASRLADRFNS